MFHKEVACLLRQLHLKAIENESFTNVNSMPEEHWSPPDWWYVDKMRRSDDAYFENMCRIIFQAALNWNVVGKIWPATQKAFDKFSTKKVSSYADSDVAV
jgi:3-methyladenine DNA glycosylase Tag